MTEEFREIRNAVGVAAIFWLSLAVAARAQDLKEQVATILKDNCYKCHGTKRDDWDASSLASAREIGDTILEKVDADKMPPGKLPKLTADEKKTLRDWLENKPAEPAQTTTEAPPKPRQFLDDAWVLKQINSDTAKQADSLYLSLANIYNAGASQQQVWDAQGAVSKAVNLLSTARNIVVPVKVDKWGIVLRVNVFDLGWNDENAQQLFKVYPYAELSSGFIRGDWLVVRGLSAPLYYSLLGVPGSERDTDASFGVDRQRFINNNIVKRAGITTSKVAFHNRAIEIAPARFGNVRLTYDTANGNADRNLITNPLAFRHDAAEYIADLPNGLSLYAAFNGQGQRQNKVPENIASDPNQFSGTTSIVPGISCIGCHKTGVQSPVSDVVRNGAPLASVGELAKVSQLYPTKDQFAAILDRDEARYTAAVKQTTEPFKSAAEPIGPLALDYFKPIDIKTAARESNADESRVTAAILADPNLQAVGLRPLTEGQTITRDTWEDVASGISPALRVAQLLGRK